MRFDVHCECKEPYGRVWARFRKEMSTPGKGSIKIMNNFSSEQDIGGNMTGIGHLIEMGMRSLLDRNL